MKWLFIITVLISSCTIERRVYSPLPVNNPALQSRNDFSINASISEPWALDLNGGLAITDHFALIAGVYTHKNKDVETATQFSSRYDSSNLLYRHNGFTVGAGAFFPLDKNLKTQLSFFGGINKGTFNMKEELYSFIPGPTTVKYNDYKSNLNRFFFQGSFNYYSKVFEGSVSTRFNFVEHRNVITDYTDNELMSYQLPPFVSKKVNCFADFAYDFRFYFSQAPKFGIHFFGLVSSRINEDDLNNSFYFYYPFRAGTGIIFRGL